MTYLLRLRCRLQTALSTPDDVQEFTERLAEAVLNAGAGNYADAVAGALYAALIPALLLLENERRARRAALARQRRLTRADSRRARQRRRKTRRRPTRRC